MSWHSQNQRRSRKTLSSIQETGWTSRENLFHLFLWSKTHISQAQASTAVFQTWPATNNAIKQVNGEKHELLSLCTRQTKKSQDMLSSWSIHTFMAFCKCISCGKGAFAFINKIDAQLSRFDVSYLRLCYIWDCNIDCVSQSSELPN